VPTLYTEAALLTATGAGVLSLFFFGAAKAILHTGVLGKWLGVLAYIAGLLAVCGFMTPFFSASVLNPATGALGRWAWTVAFVIWLFLASGAMWLEQRQRVRQAAAGGPVIPPPASTEGGAR